MSFKLYNILYIISFKYFISYTPYPLNHIISYTSYPLYHSQTLALMLLKLLRFFAFFSWIQTSNLLRIKPSCVGSCCYWFVFYLGYARCNNDKLCSIYEKVSGNVCIQSQGDWIFLNFVSLWCVQIMIQISM